MSDKDRIPAEVFILFKLEGLKTALSDSPFVFDPLSPKPPRSAVDLFLLHPFSSFFLSL